MIWWCLQVKEVAMENEYALRLKDAVAAERLRDLADRCAAEREAERARADALLAEKNEAELEYEDQLRQGEQRHQVPGLHGAQRSGLASVLDLIRG